jgi:hypothetical protein
MTRPRAALLAFCLSILLYCVAGAASAPALTLHRCESNFAPVGTGTTYEVGCEVENKAGKFETVPIKANEWVQLTVAQTAPFAFSTQIALIKTEITCETLAGSEQARNEEPKAGVMQVSGKEVSLKFTNCKVAKPAGFGCKVAEPIETTEASSLASVVSRTLTPVNAENMFTNITISGCTGAAKALNGTREVTGAATGEIPAEHPGFTNFTETSGSSLKIGGQNATFTGLTSLEQGFVRVGTETP